MKEGHWHRYHTCLLAPRKYIPGHSSDDFDTQLAYEEILEFFEQRGDLRDAFKVMLLREVCAEAGPGSYQMKKDDAVTSFMRGYWELVVSRFPDLNISDPKDRPSRGVWMMYPQGKSVILKHKMPQGNADLEVKRIHAQRLRDAVREHLEPDMHVVETGSPAAVRLMVPKLDPTQPIEQQRDHVLEALGACHRMVAWYRTVAEDIANAWDESSGG